MSDERAAKESAKPCSRCGQPDADGGGVWVDKADVLHEEWLCGGCVSRELAALHEQIMRYQADPQYDARFIEGQEKTEAMLREQHSADLREVAEMAIQVMLAYPTADSLLSAWRERKAKSASEPKESR